jgi:hypothetical protein
MAQDELRKCGSQPADKSVINRRLKAHPVPVLPYQPQLTCDIGRRRTSSSFTVDHGHKSISAERIPDRKGFKFTAENVAMFIVQSKTRKQSMMFLNRSTTWPNSQLRAD